MDVLVALLFAVSAGMAAAAIGSWSQSSASDRWTMLVVSITSAIAGLWLSVSHFGRDPITVAGLERFGAQAVQVAQSLPGPNQLIPVVAVTVVTAGIFALLPRVAQPFFFPAIFGAMYLLIHFS